MQDPFHHAFIISLNFAFLVIFIRTICHVAADHAVRAADWIRDNARHFAIFRVCVMMMTFLSVCLNINTLIMG